MHSHIASPVGVRHSADRFKKQLQLIVGEAESVPSNAQELFEKFVCCPVPGNVEISAGHSSDPAFTLPGSLRSSCLEELIEGSRKDGFDESNDETGGLVGIIRNCLLACNHDIRDDIARHLVFCGGGAGIPGLPQAVCERIKSAGSEFSSSLSASLGSIEYMPIPFHRCLLAWIGSAVFSTLKSNAEKFISNTEWEASRNSDEKSTSLAMPDWMSVNPADWKFAGPR